MLTQLGCRPRHPALAGFGAGADAARRSRTCPGTLPLQKDLATQIAEKATVINDYEAGRAIPNGAIIAKLERALGVRLPRPPKK